MKDCVIKLEEGAKLPLFGEFVLVYGVDKKVYGNKEWHVCSIDDLEDGIDFHNGGTWYWLKEDGTKIENVTHWTYLPSKPK